MEILPDWLPNIHVLLIHFPIVLLTMAFFVHLAELFTKEKLVIKSSNLLYGAGTLFTLITYLSGRSAVGQLNVPFKAEMTLSTHSDMALYTLIFFSVFTSGKILAFIYGKFNQKIISLIFFLLAVIGMYFLIRTGDLGGKLVYKYGVGTLN
ncbi:DUF2231 domain-containing protein [Xanthovirga aplysinae]|uniref:DUF2231 domain-containing protein n=1 Tax=Xanthovirga aplysinae TaxID=2529853 RepID=UPI0012BD0332|nr:DUF2231 domain-containing protein [Xanthovirga aplysinae]MTI30647.1 DUF2231 domain-containing protein [Xanthovirga aplysinae]